jgi:hypothetical protein
MKRVVVTHTFLLAQYFTGRFSVVLKKENLISTIFNHNDHEQQIKEIIKGKE